MVVVVILYLLVLVKISIVETAWDCRNAQCQQDSRRVDYRPLNYDKETPYVVAFQNVQSKEIFCLGVLISSTRALTTFACLYQAPDFIILYGSRNLNYMQTRPSSGIVHFETCQGEKLWKECDFAVAKIDPPIINSRTAVLPKGDQETVAKLLKKSMRDNRHCVGVGFGRYQIWTQNFENGKWGWTHKRDGKSKGEMFKFDMRLLADYSCNNEATLCCGTDFKEGMKNNFEKVNCAAHGNKLSPCFGESGGPVICDGYLFGLLKGTLQCPNEQKKNRNVLGFMVYVGIDHALEFIKNDYKKTYDTENRPVPDLGSFGVEVDFEGYGIGADDKPPLPPNMTNKDPKSGKGTGSAEDDDYDYYGNSNIHRPQIFILISAFFLSFSLFLNYNN